MNRRAFLSVPIAGAVAGGLAALPGTARALGFSDIMDVTDHGLHGDNQGDNLAALTTLMASCWTGTTLYFPPGIYLFSGPIVPPTRVTFRGAGRLSSILKTTNPRADLLTISTWDTTIESIGLGSIVQKTAGVIVRCTGALLKMRDVLVDGYYVGIVLNGATLSYLENVFGGSQQAPTPGRIAPGGAFLAIGPNTSAGIQLKAVSADSHLAPADQPSYGIWLSACMDLTMEGCQIMEHGISFAIGPGSGQVVASVNALNCYFDTAQRGLLICPTNGGAFARSGFTQCWFGNHQYDGIYTVVPAGTTVSGVRFDGCTASFNGGRGAVFSGPMDYYWAVNNDLRSNQLGGLLDTATGTHKVVAGNLS